MKVGDLIRVRHFGSGENGKIGILVNIHLPVGHVACYVVRIPSLSYEIGLSIEQCEVIGESR